MKKYKRIIMIKFFNLCFIILFGYKIFYFFVLFRNNKFGIVIVIFFYDELKKNKIGFFFRVRWVFVLFLLYRLFFNMFVFL